MPRLFRVTAPLLVLPLLGCPLGPADDKVEATGTCQGPVAMAIPSTQAGRVGENDCADANGRAGDIYTFTLPAGRNFEVALSGSGWEPNISVVRGTPTQPGRLVMSDEGSSAAVTRLFLTAGSYYVVVEGNRGRGGAFTLEAREIGTGCAYSYGVVGASYSGTVRTDDCTGSPGFHQDIVEFNLAAGERLSVTMTTDKEVYGELLSGSASSTPLATRDALANRPGVMSHTATSAGYYRVHILGNPSRFGVISYTVQTN